MAGRPKQKVYIYSKDNRNKIVDTLDSIQDFKAKYLENYKQTSKVPFSQLEYIDLGDKLASLKRGGREVFDKYFRDQDDLVKLSKDYGKDVAVDGYNMQGEKVMSFKNARIAAKITGMSQTTIHNQIHQNKHKGYVRSSITFKKATI